MDRPLNEDADEGGEQLVLTPSRIRCDSRVVAVYTTGTWLMHAIFLTLLALKVEHGLAAPWWAVLAPEFVVHLVQVPLFAEVLARREAQVLQQLGPPPGPRASAGLVVQYATMRKTRLRTLSVDYGCNLVESLAVLAVKLLLLRELEAGRVEAGTACWRFVFLPLWLLWPLTSAASWLKAPAERMLGSMADLACLTAVFVALKMDGVVAYSWKVVLLVPWMWFGAIFLAALAALVFTVAAYSCARARELAMPLGTLALLVSAGAQLPGFVLLARRLDGDASIRADAILAPMAVGWAAMCASALVVCVGLRWKERLRAALSAAGRTWTADDATHRSVMRADVREAQRAVDAMSDAQLARVTRKLMKHKERPVALMRVGETLWRRATEASGAAANVLKDGIASVPASPAGRGPTPPPPLLQLAHMRGSGTQEEVCVAVHGACGSASSSDPGGVECSSSAAGTKPGPCELDLETGAAVVVEIRVRAGGTPRGPPPPNSPGLCGRSGAPSPRKAAAGLCAWPLEDAASVASDGEAAASGTPRRAPAVEAADAAGAAAVAKAGPRQLALPPPLSLPLLASPARTPPPPAGDAGAGAAAAALADDGLCTICCDRRATCVFMECGHGGYCWRCAHLLYIRPPNECPVCRARIELVVQVADPDVPLGSRAPVLTPGAVERGRGLRLLGCVPCAGGQVLPTDASPTAWGRGRGSS